VTMPNQETTSGVDPSSKGSTPEVNLLARRRFP